MIVVLRLGHRKQRDKRVTTHCALVARAFGASKIILSGEQDEAVLESVAALSRKWGGPFSAAYESNWKKAVRAFKKSGKVIHLTMYGESFDAVAAQARKTKNVMIVIGAEKVPREMYALADYNAAVGSQPHSEVAALAVFLYELLGKAPLEKEFRGWQNKIIPSPRGKKVINKFRGVIGT